MPAPGTAPVEPTAMQDETVGQETPLSSGGAGRDTSWAFQVRPPLTVAAMTVTGGAVVVVAGAASEAFGPGMPTAQQCSGSAQETAPNSPVPAGAGWPITVVDGDCCPRTFVVSAGRVGEPVRQADTMSPAAVSAKGAGAPRRTPARLTRREKEGDTARRQ
jgi:hypothetical protein